MKNQLTLGLAAIIVFVSLIVYYTLRPETVPVTTPKVETAPVNTEVTEKLETIRTSGRYVDYSKAIFMSTSNSKRVLFFYSNNCPACKPVNLAFIDNEAKIPEDVLVMRVNFNDNQTEPEERELAAKYKITKPLTYVLIDSKDNEINKWDNGGFTEMISRLSSNQE